MAAPMKNTATLLSQLCLKDYTLIRRSILQSHVLCCRKMSDDSESITSIRVESEITPPSSKRLSKSDRFTKVAKAYIAKMRRLQIPGNQDKKLSRAMKAYIEKSKQYENLLEEQTHLYEVGKRHLANIMGEDPDDFKHEDVNRAIKYLLPSGLHEPKARPVMKMPIDLLPLRKVARFGADGRPFHPMFYTCKPFYFDMLYEIRQKLEDLKAKELELAKTGKYHTLDGKKLDFESSEWITGDQYRKLLKEEEITDEDYANFIKLIQRLADHPMNYEVEDYIMGFRHTRFVGIGKRKIQGVIEQEDGSKLIVAKGRRKTSQAEVKVTIPGTGKFSCNGQSIIYFTHLTCREQILFPIQFTGMLGKMDVEAKVWLGGPSGQSGAIRLAISRALLQVVDDETAEKMRIAGLLTPDPRMRERKKPGKKGARKGRTWKRR